MKETVANAIRAALSEAPPAWVDEAIARAMQVPREGDIEGWLHDAISAAVATMQARIAAMVAETQARNRETDAAERNQRARDAAYEIAMNTPDSGIVH